MAPVTTSSAQTASEHGLRPSSGDGTAPGVPDPVSATPPGFVHALRRALGPERLILVVSLLTLLVYTQGLLISLPYVGIESLSADGTVGFVWNAIPNGVRAGDRILRIGDMPLEVVRQDLRHMIWANQPGPLVDLTIERNGQIQTVTLPLNQWTWREFSERMFSQWWLAGLFWLAGLAQLLLVRPADMRRLVLTAFLCVVAVWLSASTLSRWQMWESALVVRVATWWLIALALHLHWIFPQPLRPLSRQVWIAGYGIAGLMTLAELAQWTPQLTFIPAFMAGALGVLALIAFRWWRGPRSASLHILTLAALGTFVPASVVGGLTWVGAPTSLGMVGLLGLPLLPAGYVMAALRGQLDGVEFRANRWVSLYLYGVALVSTLGLIGLIVTTRLATPEIEFPVWIILLIITATLSPWLYPRFQRWIERHILRMPNAPEHLLRALAGRVVACPDLPSLLAVLRDEVWPALLVRQWALIGLGEDGQAQVLHAERAPALETVPAGVWARLQRQPDALAVTRACETALDGLRLALPLAVNGAPVGLLLLGRRDPDDVYTPDEVEAIRALANQTAIALAHIVQTGRLRAFFQANIDRHEEERAELARELHDDILNELGRLRSGALGADADATHGRVISSVRGMISGLRPAALNYGLQVALEQLADDLSARGPLPVEARFTGTTDGWRYDPLIEQHLYRIAQQAAENALKHAAPTRVVIEAELHAERATLAVIDDGRGLPPGLATDLDALLEHRHFGLAGMHERAALIGAQVRIGPHSPQGTRVQVTWLRK